MTFQSVYPISNAKNYIETVFTVSFIVKAFVVKTTVINITWCFQYKCAGLCNLLLGRHNEYKSK